MNHSNKPEVVQALLEEAVVDEHSGFGTGEADMGATKEAVEAQAAGDPMAAATEAVKAQPTAKRRKNTSSQFVTTSQKDDYMHRGMEAPVHPHLRQPGRK